MPFDRKEYDESVASRQVNRQREVMPLVRLLQGAAPVMNEVLTGSDAWDRYLTILQGFVERLKVGRTAAQSRLSDPGVWEHHQLVKLKSDILIAEAMLDILKTVMELPKALIEGGETATEIISQFEAKHAGTAEKTLP